MRKFLFMAVLALAPVLASYARDNKEKAIDWKSLGKVRISGTVNSANVVTLSTVSNVSDASVFIQSTDGTILYDGIVNIPAMGTVALDIADYEANGNTIQVVIPETDTQEGETLEGEF